MKEIKIKRRSAAACYDRYLYLNDRAHRNHRTLTGISLTFYGCSSIFHFVAQTTLDAEWLKRPEDLEFVEYMGGSTYRAFVTEAEEDAWLLGFVKKLGLTRAIIGAHRRTTGRLDFHVLTPDVNLQGERLLTPENRVRARLVATELTEALNTVRLKENRFVLGNIRVGPFHHEVYYLKKEDLPAPQLGVDKKAPVVAAPEGKVPKNLDVIQAVTPPEKPRDLIVPPRIKLETSGQAGKGGNGSTKTAATPVTTAPQKAPVAPPPVGRAVGPDDDEKRKRREQEEKRNDALRKASAAELLAWLHSLPDENEKPPETWLACAAALEIKDPAGHYTRQHFLTTALPQIAKQQRHLENSLTPESALKLTRSLELAGDIIKSMEKEGQKSKGLESKGPTQSM